ncbi:Uncharacterised protein [Streptococcus pneumoniae]|jgi:hypothetical protein|nr:conserved hypothetical protein [Stutzerimonas stutzeri DSM 4166]CJL00798.1 Uncharacterised protein [Streptococcus pneumoniae]
MRLHHKSLCHILCGGAVVIATHPASAAFVEDSKASIDLRNFYMNRVSVPAPASPRPRNGPRASC